MGQHERKIDNGILFPNDRSPNKQTKTPVLKAQEIFRCLGSVEPLV